MLTPTLFKVTWSFLGVPFSLSTDDPEVHELAQRIFSFWENGLDQRFSPGVSWSVTRAADASPGNWSVTSDPVVPDIPTWSFTISGALGHIEAAATRFLSSMPAHPPTLHAAVLSSATENIAVVGRSTAGKTTLATWFGLQGYRLLTDDFSFLEITDDAVLAKPVPERVHLRGTSRELIGEERYQELLAYKLSMPCEDCMPRGLLFQPRERIEQPCPNEVPLSAIFFLQRDGAEILPAEVHSLDAGSAAISLFKYLGLQDRTSHATALDTASRIADLVSAFDVGRGNLHQTFTNMEAVLDK